MSGIKYYSEYKLLEKKFESNRILNEENKISLLNINENIKINEENTNNLLEYRNIFINAFKKCELEKRDCLTDLNKILEKLDNYDLSMKIPNESTNINSSFEQFFNFSDP